MFASLRDVRHKKDVAEGQGGGTNSDSIPAAQDTRSVGSTIRLEDEPWRDAEAAGSPTASDTLPIHSEVQLKPNAATTPRVSDDFIADAGQQRLELAQQLKQQ